MRVRGRSESSPRDPVFVPESAMGTLASRSLPAHIQPMQAVQTPENISVEDYLEQEERTEVRHEYLGGVLYAMAGGSQEHNLISLNLAAAFRAHLRGKPCRVFVVDLKVRQRIAGEDIFYYPDVVVTCDPRDTDRNFVSFPVLLIEVLSEGTERTDRREKFLSYIRVETLKEYVLVAQDKMEVTLFRRANQWEPEVLTKPEQNAGFGSLGLSLPLTAIYEGITFAKAG